MQNWDDLRHFLAVSRTGSIRGAARVLGVNHSTVSRRISALEADLGTRLFERSLGGYLLTSAGELLRDSALQIEALGHSISRTVAGLDGALRGLLRVALPDSLGLGVLMPDLKAFAELHPEIELELLLSYGVVDLDRREADVAIRFSNAPSESLVGRKVLKISRAVYGAPAYLSERGWPGDSQGLSWIGWENSEVANWMLQSPFPTLGARHHVNHSLAQVQAAKAGLGISLLPCFLDAEPGLRRISPPTPDGRDIWVLTHADLRRTARVQAFIGFIAEALGSKRARFEGQLCP